MDRGRALGQATPGLPTTLAVELPLPPDASASRVLCGRTRGEHCFAIGEEEMRVGIGIGIGESTDSSIRGVR
jgi:hypothetical protein